MKSAADIRKHILFLDERAAECESTGRNAVLPNKKVLHNGEAVSVPQLIEIAFRYAIDYIRSVRNGEFSHTLDSRSCNSGKRTCGFYGICRVYFEKQRGLQRKKNGKNY